MAHETKITALKSMMTHILPIAERIAKEKPNQHSKAGFRSKTTTAVYHPRNVTARN